MKLEYKPVAVQDECFGGSEKEPRIWVIVKMQAQGKKNLLAKYDVREFPDVNYLDKWLNETKLPVIPATELRAGIGATVRLLAKASEPQCDCPTTKGLKWHTYDCVFNPNPNN